jgi:hypothetical protein
LQRALIAQVARSEGPEKSNLSEAGSSAHRHSRLARNSATVFTPFVPFQIQCAKLDIFMEGCKFIAEKAFCPKKK